MVHQLLNRLSTQNVNFCINLALCFHILSSCKPGLSSCGQTVPNLHEILRPVPYAAAVASSGEKCRGGMDSQLMVAIIDHHQVKLESNNYVGSTGYVVLQ